MTDNRSPAFAPEIGADDVHAMTMMTGGYPAEYGRKLGGVIEVVTADQPRRGLRRALSVIGQAASIRRRGDGLLRVRMVATDRSVAASRARRPTDISIRRSKRISRTTARSRTFSLRLEHDLSAANRSASSSVTAVRSSWCRTSAIQQEAGQRQDRRQHENMRRSFHGSASSRRSVRRRRARHGARRVSAALWSNEESTPIMASAGSRV